MTRQRTADPRELEAGLLLDAAARLQHVRDAGATDAATMSETVAFNARLWTIFLASSLRQRHSGAANDNDGIARLAQVVLAASARLTAPAKRQVADADPSADLATLIDINRTVAVGLRRQ